MKRSDLPIEAPCSATWSTMTRDGQKRFCDACKKHVHDLSAMTPENARAVLDAPRARDLCVRYLYDDEGNILFRPSYDLVPQSMLARARRFVTAAGVVALPLTLNACMGAAPMPPTPPTASASPIATSAALPDAGASENQNPVEPISPTSSAPGDAK
ncbi:MAG: hypothetical protein ACRELY_19585 [Polyangiaceae bacterium]